MLPKHSRATSSLVPHVLQVVFPSKGRLNSVAREFSFSRQNRTPVVKRSSAAVTDAPLASVATSNPPFLRHPVLFGSNSIELTAATECSWSVLLELEGETFDARFGYTNFTGRCGQHFGGRWEGSPF